MCQKRLSHSHMNTHFLFWKYTLPWYSMHIFVSSCTYISTADEGILIHRLLFYSIQSLSFTIKTLRQPINIVYVKNLRAITSICATRLRVIVLLFHQQFIDWCGDGVDRRNYAEPCLDFRLSLCDRTFGAGTSQTARHPQTVVRLLQTSATVILS